ncbi:hypothetical protein BC629DRAFT_1438260 [Irpex lacteus]|nr:hypothetical protein BC629DRAFT_1438260 [Irpex lacteus]
MWPSPKFLTRSIELSPLLGRATECLSIFPPTRDAQLVISRCETGRARSSAWQRRPDQDDDGDGRCLPSRIPNQLIAFVNLDASASPSGQATDTELAKLSVRSNTIRSAHRHSSTVINAQLITGAFRIRCGQLLSANLKSVGRRSMYDNVCAWRESTCEFGTIIVVHRVSATPDSVPLRPAPCRAVATVRAQPALVPQTPQSGVIREFGLGSGYTNIFEPPLKVPGNIQYITHTHIVARYRVQPAWPWAAFDDKQLTNACNHKSSIDAYLGSRAPLKGLGTGRHAFRHHASMFDKLPIQHSTADWHSPKRSPPPWAWLVLQSEECTN